ncbi:MAG: chromosome partitioning protein ParB [Cyanobacteria bacterium RYN_339]|nr:chromosome partitioning protein ParB [Cyanobacteria bacterium RYN_339]
MPNAGTWDQLLSVTTAKLGGSAAAERRKLPIAHISPNADQPRKFFDAQALADLVASISVHGVLQPILVRTHPADPGRYQVVAGERRWLAAQQAGLVDVPVVVREMNDQEALELGLVENVLREDITPMEEARALKKLIDAFGYSYAKLGERLGKNKAYVDHRVRLLRMPGEVQDALERGVAEGEEGKVRRPFTPRHAGMVVQLEDAEERVALIEAVFSEGLSVAETGARLRGIPTAPVAVSVAPAPKPTTVVAAPAPEPLSAVAVDVDVDVETLAVYKLIARAQKRGGQASAAKLLAALQRDARTLRELHIPRSL